MRMHHMHMDRNRALGLAIKARRQAMGLKQPQLAERLTSLDQASISRIENGKQGLTLDSLEGDVAPANPDDLAVLGLPGPEGVVVGGHPAAIACHATVVLQNGLQRSGILNVVAPSHSIFKPGDNQSLVVSWAPDDVIEAVRQQAVTSKERDLQQQRTTLEHQRALVENASNQNACYQGWKIAVEAKSLLKVEPADQVVADLENRYAYGPNGEMYRDSEDAASMIKHITAAVQMTPEERQAKGVPDYTSQTFLHSCPAMMSRQGN